MVKAEEVLTVQEQAQKVADKSFDPRTSLDCSVCVEVGELRLRVGIVHERKRELVWMEDYPSDVFSLQRPLHDTVYEVLHAHPFLTNVEWQSVRLVFDSPNFTIIPADFFRKEYAKDYLRLVSGKDTSDQSKIVINSLSTIDAHLVSGVPATAYDSIRDLFSLQPVSLLHAAFPVITAALSGHQLYRTNKIVTLFVEYGHFWIVVSENQQLLFSNRFKYQNAQELTYFTLFALNQLGVLPEETAVIAYGEITPFSDTFSELNLFFGSLRLGSRKPGLGDTAGLEDIPGHRYPLLFETLSQI